MVLPNLKLHTTKCIGGLYDTTEPVVCLLKIALITLCSLTLHRFMVLENVNMILKVIVYNV